MEGLLKSMGLNVVKGLFKGIGLLKKTFGPELIINGKFPVNVDDWDGNNTNAVRTWESGAMRCTTLADWAYTRQIHPEWIEGISVIVKFDITENNSICQLGVGLGNSLATQTVIEPGDTGSYSYIDTIPGVKEFQIRPSSAGAMDLLIDNISVKEVL